MLADIYFFNPTCETAIANGSAFYTAPFRLRNFESDLSYLAVWLAEEKDQVLIKGETSEVFELRLRSLGFRLPETIQLDKALSDPDWLGQSRGYLFPWGWSPAAVHLFRDVVSKCSEAFKVSAVAKWDPAQKPLYGRETSMHLLSQIIENSAADWLPGLSDVPVRCTSLEEIYQQIDERLPAVVKSPWSSSGRGLLLFPNPDLKKKNDEVLGGMLRQQGFVTVEPWLDKVVDFSFQFYSRNGDISYIGRTFFETDGKGRYQRTFLTDKTNYTEEVNDFLVKHHYEVVDMLLMALKSSGYSSLYEGWIGVDALVFRTASGKLKLQPMVEINGRFTMGAIALKMRDHLAPDSCGFLQIFYSKSKSFLDFCQKQEGTKPLNMIDGKISSGFFSLTPPLPDHHFGAYIEVTENQK
jgi:hypothetical protein